MKILRGRLVGKNQMTITTKMQEMLGMERGDELEFCVIDGDINAARLLKPLPMDLFRQDVLAELGLERETGRAAAKGVPAEQLRANAGTPAAGPAWYRARLVGKNQITIPVEMQRALGMQPRDELQFWIEDGRIERVRIFKMTPVDLIDPEVLRELSEEARTNRSLLIFGSVEKVEEHLEERPLVPVDA
jgi:bifunctional DNA-binding transcriptional regulator/antitoxin component of YhaV-PrlF toxin-antitoxin module